MEDYEIQIVNKGCCPYCRHQVEAVKNDEEDTENSITDESNTSTPGSPSNGQNSWQ